MSKSFTKFFIFTLANEETVIIEAPRVAEAMKEIEFTWYAGILEKGFTVKVATGKSTWVNRPNSTL